MVTARNLYLLFNLLPKIDEILWLWIHLLVTKLLQLLRKSAYENGIIELQGLYQFCLQIFYVCLLSSGLLHYLANMITFPVSFGAM
jgi:hypothetical protein